RRTDVVRIFPNRASLIRLAGAALMEQQDERTAAPGRYFSQESMKKLYAQKSIMDPNNRTQTRAALSYSQVAMGKLRRKHSPSFKAKVVLELLKETKSVSELASEYGVHPNLLHRWRREVLDSLPIVFSSKESWAAQKAEYEQKIEELYTEIGRLSAQLSWLKKKGLTFESE